MQKQWCAYSASWPFDRTVVAIREEFGLEGELLWLSLIAAAKRGYPQGTFSYVEASDEDAWLRLRGYVPRPLPFLLAVFWRRLGDMKQTKKTRSGGMNNVEIRHWKEWQETKKRQDDRERIARKRAQNRANIQETDELQVSDTNDNDSGGALQAPPPHDMTGAGGRQRAVRAAAAPGDWDVETDENGFFIPGPPRAPLPNEPTYPEYPPGFRGG